MATLVCVPITMESPDQALRDAHEAAAAGADLVELRVDSLASGSPDAVPTEAAAISRVVTACPAPCIVTCRHVSEGGAYDGPEDVRVALYQAVCLPDASMRPPAYIDIEAAAYLRSHNIRQKIHNAVRHPGQVRTSDTGLILSSHDFTGRPADLSRRVADMAAQPAAAVLKVAFRARSARDNLELFDLLRESPRPAVALGMGEFGLLSRVLAPKFNAFLTFASLRPAAATAPGQPTITDLLSLYRFRRIGPRTRVFAILGYPLGHSLSPLVHNAAFADAGVDAVYVPIPVVGAAAAGSDERAAAQNAAATPLSLTPASDSGAYESFKATLHALIDHPALDFSGCSVTIPHKENLVRFAIEAAAAGEFPWEIDALSRACGAANTLVIRRDSQGKPCGATMINTDAPAAVACLVRRLGELAGLRIGIFGAGGAARAIAAGLLMADATVVIYSRSRERGEQLVSTMKTLTKRQNQIVAAGAELLERSCCAALVNATPIGMKGGPAEHESAFTEAALRACAGRSQEGVSCGKTLVFDTVYNPIQTPTIRAARAAGLDVLDGVEMFVEQAKLQAEAFGAGSGVGRFDDLVRTALTMR